MSCHLGMNGVQTNVKIAFCLKKNPESAQKLDTSLPDLHSLRQTTLFKFEILNDLNF